MALDELKRMPLTPCTTCNYRAKIRPKNIGVSGSFTSMNMLTLYRDLPRARRQEDWLAGGYRKARVYACIKRGKREAVCPQHTSDTGGTRKAAAALL